MLNKLSPYIRFSTGNTKLGTHRIQDIKRVYLKKSASNHGSLIIHTPFLFSTPTTQQKCFVLSNVKGRPRYFYTIYACRSKAVHSGKLDYREKLQGLGHVETSQFLEQADTLCTLTIKKVIQDGVFPDWKDIILGES